MKRQSRALPNRILPFYALAIAAGASTLALPANAGLFSISEKEEIQAGQQVRQQAYKEFGQPLAANHPMSQRVRALGQKFAKLSERKNIPYTYEVLRNDKVLNAFAAPGGPIFVTTKLVNTTANDAELAYVLGHETAHIDRKHIVKAVEKQQKVGLGVGILGAILGGGGGSDLFGVFSNVAFTVWSRGYGRDQERDSDAVGVRWMSQLGFDPKAAISMLGKLGSGGGGGLERYLATHPNPKDRQATVQAQINKEQLVNVATKAGGPFLTAKDLSSYDYTASNTDTGYNDVDYDYRDEDEGTVGNARQASFGAPLIMVNRGNYSVIMAPIGGFARWARADVEADQNNSNVISLRRGSNIMRIRRNSSVANINGRNVTLSAAAAVYNDLLYAPLGNLADGVGASASLSNDNRTVWLTIDGQRWYMNLR